MKGVEILRWTARVLGIASALLLFAFAFGGREHLRFTPAEAVGFMLFPVGVVVGFAVAWWNDLIGGLITVVSLAVFALYLFAGSGRWIGPYFFLLAAPGFLHVLTALVAWWTSPGKGLRQTLATPSSPGDAAA